MNVSEPLDCELLATVDAKLTNLTNSTRIPTLFDSYPESLLQFGAVACILISVWGIPANVATIIAFAWSPRIRNATVTFIINLCIADTLFCMFTPPLAASTFIHRRWIHGDFLCQLFPVLRYSNFAVSLLTVVVIAINRYVLIAYPKSYPKLFSKVRIGITVASLWIISFGLLFPAVIGVWGTLGFDPTTGTCSILSKNGKSPKNMLFILCLIVPSITFCVCYSRIYWLVRKASKSVRNHDATSRNSVKPTEIVLKNNRSKGTITDIDSNKETNSSSSRTSRFSNIRLMVRRPAASTKTNALNSTSFRKLSREMKLLRMILVLFCSYMLCFVPISLVKLFSKENDIPVVNVLGYISVYSNACVNPIIYVIMSKEYRSAYKNLFLCRPADFFSGNSD